MVPGYLLFNGYPAGRVIETVPIQAHFFLSGTGGQFSMVAVFFPKGSVHSKSRSL
jgi:hypothetical protein